MRTVVAKFGGTSVATDESRAHAIEHIRKLREAGYAVVAVVSAMGRKGQPYATDTLIGLLSKKCDRRTSDLLISCGETISACVMADQLGLAGITAVPMNGQTAGILTDGVFGNADIRGMNAKTVQAILDSGAVPVITGFQGATPEGEVATLGRGGSDTSAVEIGGYLRAEKVLIFTDVPGIAVADPRVVPEAEYLSSISYRDMISLARWGAKVIHPRAVQAGERHNIPVWVLSTFENRAGTKIADNIPVFDGLLGIAALKHCLIGGESGVLWLSDDAVSPDADGTDTVITALFRNIPMQTLKKAYSGNGVYVEAVDRDTAMVHVIVSDEEATQQIHQIHSDWCGKVQSRLSAPVV